MQSLSARIRLTPGLAFTVVSIVAASSFAACQAGSMGGGGARGDAGSAGPGLGGAGGAAGGRGANAGHAGGGAAGSGAIGGTSGLAGTAGQTGSAGAADQTGAGGASGAAAGGGALGSYALPPPRQCGNQFFVPGCTRGDPTSACGGHCSSINACQENASSKPGDDVTFLCPSFMLFSDAMLQAAVDDFGSNPPFNYAVVGHDTDTDGLDPGARSTCCQCYQLVFQYPAENQANVNASAAGPSAIPIPPPLIVQSFNTAAGGGQNFDVYMGAGGFGANNACDPNGQPQAASGLYTYTSFPDDGECCQGGVKAAGIYSECKTSINWVTTESLSLPACQNRVASACNMIAAPSSAVTAETVRSCTRSNAPSSYYHMNWTVYARRIECPAHLTEVTGCKLAPQGLPAANRNVTTAAQAAGDATFRPRYTTTTMQDCCKPTCAWQDNVVGASAGLKAVGLYDSFYSCDQQGRPLTE
jgi:hypothetical protein